MIRQCLREQEARHRPGLCRALTGACKALGLELEAVFSCASVASAHCNFISV